MGDYSFIINEIKKIPKDYDTYKELPAYEKILANLRIELFYSYRRVIRTIKDKNKNDT